MFGELRSHKPETKKKKKKKRRKKQPTMKLQQQKTVLSGTLFFFFAFFFLFVVNFVIHWNETAMGLHVFPIPIPPPTSLSTCSP